MNRLSKKHKILLLTILLAVFLLIGLILLTTKNPASVQPASTATLEMFEGRTLQQYQKEYEQAYPPLPTKSKPLDSSFINKISAMEGRNNILSDYILNLTSPIDQSLKLNEINLQSGFKIQMPEGWTLLDPVNNSIDRIIYKGLSTRKAIDAEPQLEIVYRPTTTPLSMDASYIEVRQMDYDSSLDCEVIAKKELDLNSDYEPAYPQAYDIKRIDDKCYYFHTQKITGYWNANVINLKKNYRGKYNKVTFFIAPNHPLAAELLEIYKNIKF